MKKTDALVQLLLPDIAGKTVLEAACGSGDFSVSASEHASRVCCIDLVDSRLDGRINRENIRFEVMDAARMRYPDGMFDSVFVYNALSHIRPQWEEIKRECLRVAKPGGKIFIIGTWKIDMNLIASLFPDAKQNGDFLIAELRA